MPETSKAVVEKPKFKIAQLREKCQTLFNVDETSFNGAFYNETSRFTIEEANKVINRWLKKEVHN